MGREGRSRPPSFPKPGKGITPSGRAGGQPRSPTPRLHFWLHVSQEQQFQPPPCSLQRTKLSRGVKLSAQTSPAAPRVPPAHPAGACPGRAGGIWGPGRAGWPGQTRDTAGDTAGTCAGTGGPCSTPRTAKRPKKGCDPTGTTGHPSGAEEMLRGRTGGMLRGMLERARGDAEDARGQRGGCRGCSGQDRDAGAGLEHRTRDAKVMTGGP